MRNKNESRIASEVAAQFRSLQARGVNTLFVYSAGDIGLNYFDVILGNVADELAALGRFRVETVRRTDHTLASLRAHDEVIRIVEDWSHSFVQDRAYQGSLSR